MSRVYVEPARELPVYGEYDVVVAGGGTAGMIAGIAAARNGAKTLVIERMGYLGGQFTGFMNTSWTCSDQTKRCVGGIAYEYFKNIEAIGGVEAPNYDKDAYILYDSERAKYAIVKMYEQEENLEALYLTMVTRAIMDGNKLKGLIIENKSGRQVVYAKQFIDCTGDADLLAFSGSHYEELPVKDYHPASLIAKISNVDVKKLREYYDAHPELQKGEEYLGHLPHAGFYGFRLTEELQGVELPKELEYLRDWFILFYSTPNPNEIILNMTGTTALDGTDAGAVSKGTDMSIIRMWQVLPLFRKYIPGFEHAFISATAPALGIRESRKVIGGVRMTRESIMGATKYPDAVCSYQSPLGYHTPDGHDITFMRMVPGTAYDISLRSMVPLDVDGIIVAGRNISVESKACGSTRSMSNCMTLGHCAGAIAAYAAANNIEMRNIPVDVMREMLKEQDIYFAE